MPLFYFLFFKARNKRHRKIRGVRELEAPAKIKKMGNFSTTMSSLECIWSVEEVSSTSWGMGGTTENKKNKIQFKK